MEDLGHIQRILVKMLVEEKEKPENKNKSLINRISKTTQYLKKIRI
jgi:hypothetical protein